MLLRKPEPEPESEVRINNKIHAPICHISRLFGCEWATYSYISTYIAQQIHGQHEVLYKSDTENPCMHDYHTSTALSTTCLSLSCSIACTYCLVYVHIHTIHI